MKKVLFINTRLVFPTTGGRKVVLYNYCKGLREKYKCNIDVITFLDSGDEKYIDCQPDFINLKQVLPQPNIFEKAFNLFLYTFLLKKWPIQISLYYSRKTQRMINQYIKKENPDIVVCDMVRTAQYIVKFNGSINNKILDMDDLLSRRYKRQIEFSDIGVEALGTYLKKIPKEFHSLLNFGSIMKKVLKIEYKLLKKYEMFLNEYFDSYIFVSPLEAQIYNDMCGFNKADYVTIGVDYDYYSSFPQPNIDKKNEIVFLGNMNISHNRHSVEYFLNNIYPSILNINSNIKFKVVGKCDDVNYIKFLESKEIVVTGEVDDIRPHIMSSKVSIAYLPYGSGIKTKILETLAMGVPVVTNDVGAEGIIVEENNGLFICNDIESTVKAIMKLIFDEDYNKYCSKQAQKFICENYTWETTLKKFKNII